MEAQKKQKELTDLAPQAIIKESQYNHDTIIVGDQHNIGATILGDQYNHDTTIKGDQYNRGLTVDGKMVFDSRTQFKGGIWKADNEGNQTEYELVKKEI